MRSRLLCIVAVGVGLTGCERTSHVPDTRSAPVAASNRAPASSTVAATSTSSPTANETPKEVIVNNVPTSHTQTKWGNTHRAASLQYATFGAGCFWGVESTFRKLEGVVATSVGYSGGQLNEPSYKEVCTGATGHAEVVQVIYDPAAIAYDTLLTTLWQNHDPTQVNRQGPDHGTQYRTVIFTHDDAQAKSAAASKTALGTSGKHRRPIATIIESYKKFWPAEEYHQQYLEKKGLDSCGTGSGTH